jgi:phosphate transport system protein
VSRRGYNEALKQVEDDILFLASMVEDALTRSVKLLKERDFEGSYELIDRDRSIDGRRYAVEAETVTLLATQQPAAGDMRALTAAMFIANELERIADYAKGIARVNLRIGEEPLMKPLVIIPRMAEIAVSMVNRALVAYVRQDIDLAQAIILEDEAVDALYEQFYAELMTLLIQDPSKMRQANLVLMAAHNLERTADRATNICERVIFCVTGQLTDTGWEDDID